MKWTDRKKLEQIVDSRNNSRRIKIGDERFFKEARKNLNKTQIQSIQSSFDYFKKDIRDFCRCVKFVSKDQKGIFDTFNLNKNNLPIFEIEGDDVDYNIDFPVIPFRKFFISTDIIEEVLGELYGINGFFVLDLDSTHLYVSYFWSGITTSGWKPEAMLISKSGILKDVEETEFYGDEHKFSKEINTVALRKFKSIMKKLIYKISKNEYGEYKVHSNGVYTKKEISRDVMGHKRHFWKDSGRFILPTLSKEELLKRGYEVAEIAYRNGTLRTNVPFKIISSYKTGDNKEKENNKVYSLISKRIWRSEEKVYNILRELFPDKIIRRHDRKTLKGLELDFNIPELRLGIEYDGEQHFDRKVCENAFKSDFDALVKRDRKKDKLCKRKNITLIRIKYDEPLNKTHIKKRLVGFF